MTVNRVVCSGLEAGVCPLMKAQMNLAGSGLTGLVFASLCAASGRILSAGGELLLHVICTLQHAHTNLVLQPGMLLLNPSRVLCCDFLPV
jgi:hypothetical protein